MDVLGAVGFWSYARADDEAEAGRITRLANLLASEYVMLTGEDLTIFVDRDDIAWGDEWRSRIDEALEGTTFFVPIVTPRYFKSAECRKELFTFDMHAESRGVRELLLPLLYVDVPDLSPESDDEAMALVARMQYERWTALRLAAEDSAEYRKGVNKLARRLVEISEEIGNRLPSLTVDSAGKVVDDIVEEEPGLIDVMAEAENALPHWTSTLERLALFVKQLGELMQDAVQQIERSDARGKGFAGRLLAARALAARLQPLASKVLEVGTEYGSDLVKVDSGVITLIRQLGEMKDTLPEDQRRDACELFDALRELAGESRDTTHELAELLGSARNVAQLSRDLRPPLRDIDSGLRRVLDGQAVIDEWERLIDGLGLDCSG
jgi:hypothetical protein